MITQAKLLVYNKQLHLRFTHTDLKLHVSLFHLTYKSYCIIKETSLKKILNYGSFSEALNAILLLDSYHPEALTMVNAMKSHLYILHHAALLWVGNNLCQ